MKTTILIPHYKTGDMTAYSVGRFLALKGRHDVNIIVIDNGGDVGVDKIPVHPDVSIIRYPEGIIQSHGLAFDHILETQWDSIQEVFITAESDSFPTDDRWLDHYEGYANEGWDMAGSLMRLSGGSYIHPAGAMYRKKNWTDAKRAAENYGYHFYEKLSPPYHHVMSKAIIEGAEEKKAWFLPISVSVFHQGMGFRDELLETYGLRDTSSEPPIILPRDGAERYLRIGYEPGQWFSYWHAASGLRIKEVPTEIKWMNNRVNQCQEYTLMDNGFKHLWGITTYTECGHGGEVDDVVAFKKKQLEGLLP